MNFAVPFSDADIHRASSAVVTPRMFATATIEGARALFVFRDRYLKPMMQGLLTVSPREQALLDLHYRMVGHLASTIRLAAPIHFQGIAAAARSLFELGLDIALIARDRTDESVDRLHAFTRVERFRWASKTVAFFASRPVPDDMSIEEQRALCGDPDGVSEVDAMIEKYWGRDRHGKLLWPKHWSSHSDARRRAEVVGGPWEEWYVRSYAVLSWHVHGGVVGIAGLPQDAFDVISAQAHLLSFAVTAESFDVLGRELAFSNAMPDWKERVSFLRNVVGLALVDDRLASLGEPPRFLYLEPEELALVGGDAVPGSIS